MHIKTDAAGRIEDIHIEMWDENAMPPDLAIELMAFRGRTEGAFISFAFTRKLFFVHQNLFCFARGNRYDVFMGT